MRMLSLQPGIMSKGISPKFKILCLILASVLLSAPVLAQEDFEFYKKHGHSDKSWNEMVKQGFTAYDQQDCNTAMTHLKAAVAEQCQDALVYFKLAVCSELSGSPYTSLQYYQLAQEKLQNLQVIHRYQKDIFENYGRALFKAKRYNEAMPYLTRAAAIGNPSFGLYYMVGFLYSQKKDYPAAIDYYKRALTQDTTGSPPVLLGNVHFEVGRTYFDNKDYKTALHHLNQAVQLDPNHRGAAQLIQQCNTALQQSSIVEMMQKLSTQKPGSTTEAPPAAQPPPPAASQLPPLNPQAPADPTHPLGSTVPTGVPAAPATSPQPGTAPPSQPQPAPQPPPQKIPAQID